MFDYVANIFCFILPPKTNSIHENVDKKLLMLMLKLDHAQLLFNVSHVPIALLRSLIPVLKSSVQLSAVLQNFLYDLQQKITRVNHLPDF